MQRNRYVPPCGLNGALPAHERDSIRIDPISEEVLDAQRADSHTAPTVGCRPDVQPIPCQNVKFFKADHFRE